MIVSGLTLTLIARIPAAGIEVFRQYEDLVLPLLSSHGGVLQRRLTSADGTTEIHIVHFASRAALDHYRSDPRRIAAAPRLLESGAAVELLEVEDVPI